MGRAHNLLSSRKRVYIRRYPHPHPYVISFPLQILLSVFCINFFFSFFFVKRGEYFFPPSHSFSHKNRDKVPFSTEFGVFLFHDIPIPTPLNGSSTNPFPRKCPPVEFSIKSEETSDVQFQHFLLFLLLLLFFPTLRGIALFYFASDFLLSIYPAISIECSGIDQPKCGCNYFPCNAVLFYWKESINYICLALHSLEMSSSSRTMTTARSCELTV